MPQMAPIMWTSMFLVFSLLFILTSIKIFYSNIYAPMNKNAQHSVSLSLMNWKW